MEPTILLTHSQENANYPYSEPQLTNPHSIPLFNIYFNTVLSSTPGFQSGFIPSCFPNKNLYAHFLASVCATRFSHLILRHLITRSEKCRI